MIVGFAGNLEKPGIAEIRSKLMAQAERLGCECVAFDSVEAVRLTRLAPELLVVIGGDGSLLRFASVAAGRNLPILGVNLGRIGFLSEIAADEFELSLARIQKGDYRLERRMMLRCRVNDGECWHCLNDILVFKQSFSGTIQVGLSCDGQEVGTVFCDGIIASTPTGSTAYNLSAGGPVVTQNLDAIVVTPVCSHTLHVRPVVSSACSIWSFQVNETGFVAGDGIRLSEVRPDDRIEVTRSDRIVQFIRFSEQNVFELIQRKLS